MTLCMPWYTNALIWRSQDTDGTASQLRCCSDLRFVLERQHIIQDNTADLLACYFRHFRYTLGRLTASVMRKENGYESRERTL